MNAYELFDNGRIILRPVEVNDAEAIHRYAGDKSINMMLFLPNDTIEETYSFVEKAVMEWKKDKPQDYEYVIIYGNDIVGGINLEVTDEEGVYEIGWLVHKDYRNKGIVTEAAGILISHAFLNLKAHKVIAHCDSLNVASEKVMKKNGMTCVSDSGTRTYEKTGVVSGEYTYEISKENWIGSNKIKKKT